MSETKLTDLKPDTNNANAGTERGQYMIDHSLTQYGAGRSILIDKDDNVIAGNKTLQAAIDAGLELEVIETDGKKLVAVKRTDLDLYNGDDKARLLAYADNRASEVGLEWDTNNIIQDLQNGLNLDDMFRDWELEQLVSDDDDFDVDAAWEGMPEFEQDDKQGIRLIVHFENEKDRHDFFNLIGQKFTEKTKFIWYPYKKPDILKDKTYSNGS